MARDWNHSRISAKSHPVKEGFTYHIKVVGFYGKIHHHCSKRLCDNGQELPLLTASNMFCVSSREQSSSIALEQLKCLCYQEVMLLTLICRGIISDGLLCINWQSTSTDNTERYLDWVVFLSWGNSTLKLVTLIYFDSRLLFSFASVWSWRAYGKWQRSRVQELHTERAQKLL